MHEKSNIKIGLLCFILKVMRYKSQTHSLLINLPYYVLQTSLLKLIGLPRPADTPLDGRMLVIPDLKHWFPTCAARNLRIHILTKHFLSYYVFNTNKFCSNNKEVVWTDNPLSMPQLCPTKFPWTFKIECCFFGNLDSTQEVSRLNCYFWISYDIKFSFSLTIFILIEWKCSVSPSPLFRRLRKTAINDF
jgi:hypothetical protein